MNGNKVYDCKVIDPGPDQLKQIEALEKAGWERVGDVGELVIMLHAYETIGHLFAAWFVQQGSQRKAGSQ